MARIWYGGTLADYGIDVSTGRPLAGAVFDVRTGPTPGGGVVLTDLLDETGATVTQATANTRGFVRFQAPDGTVGTLYLLDADDHWYAINPMSLADQVAAGGSASLLGLAASPELLVSGAITRDGSGAATSAALVWPDGATGTFTADTVSAGAVDAYHVTHVLAGVTTTYTQAAVTRDGSGNVTNRPGMVAS